MHLLRLYTTGRVHKHLQEDIWASASPQLTKTYTIKYRDLFVPMHRYAYSTSHIKFREFSRCCCAIFTSKAQEKMKIRRNKKQQNGQVRNITLLALILR